MKRGSLIHFALMDNARVVRRHKPKLTNLLKRRSGGLRSISNDKLVRVGLGTNIYWRLKGHAKSKKLVWNTASLFIIGEKNLKYL